MQSARLALGRNAMLPLGAIRSTLPCSTNAAAALRTRAALSRVRSFGRAQAAQQQQQLRSSCRTFSTASAAATPASGNATPAAAASTSSTGGQQQGSSSGSADSEDGPQFGPDFNSDPLGSDRGIAYWLFGCSAMVFGMVSLGGLTRLTKSGLSMVEWKPATFMPPTTEAHWQEEFEKYQQFPEYKRVNNQMSLSDFKFIYLMEFSHRLLGRGVGIAFALPGLYFLLKGRINSRLASRLGLAFAAGGAQGAIGWWMVRSGLENPHETKQSGQVHVSPYRLATHLISAFGIYALLFTTALRVHPSRYSHTLTRGSPDWAAMTNFFHAAPVRQLRLLAAVTTGVVACTVFSGAFVAGNEAGLVYNEFPLMGGRIVPEDIVSPYLHPVWRNAFENSTTVQFEHRVLALTTTVLALGVFVASKRAGRNALVQQWTKSSALVHQRFRNIQKASHAVLGMVSVQVSLGIATLLLYVPVPLATLHQAGSLTLLTFSLWLLYTTRDPTARKFSGQLMQLWAKSNAGSKQAAAAEFLKLQSPGMVHQLSNVFRDLAQGRVHKGTALVTLALLLTAATGYSAKQLYELTQEEKQKKNKAITA